MVKIYTKKGDRGKTSLFDGTKISKKDKRIEAIGSVDELNSVIGLSLVNIKSKELSADLEEVQNDLFEIGGSLAYPHRLPLSFLKDRTKELEKLIDFYTVKLPLLSNFILPGGGKAGANLHLARTVCRRAERRIVGLSKIDSSIVAYINRLSDLLFTLARYVNHKEKKKEKIWRKK